MPPADLPSFLRLAPSSLEAPIGVPGQPPDRRLNVWSTNAVPSPTLRAVKRWDGMGKAYSCTVNGSRLYTHMVYSRSLKGLSGFVNASHLPPRCKDRKRGAPALGRAAPRLCKLRTRATAVHAEFQTRIKKLRPLSRKVYLECLRTGAPSTASAACSWKRAT